MELAAEFIAAARAMEFKKTDAIHNGRIFGTRKLYQDLVDFVH